MSSPEDFRWQCCWIHFELSTTLVYLVPIHPCPGMGVAILTSKIGFINCILATLCFILVPCVFETAALKLFSLTFPVPKNRWFAQRPAAHSGCLEFPNSFVFGVATSAYQIEAGSVDICLCFEIFDFCIGPRSFSQGAAALDGREASIWDTFCYDGNASCGATGEVACDHYHLFKDIK